MTRSIPSRAAASAAIALALASAGATRADAPATPGRFAVEGAIHAEGRSADGRFSGGGEARFVPQAAAADGRFALKATQAPAGACAPASDPIFRNGFEP